MLKRRPALLINFLIGVAFGFVLRHFMTEDRQIQFPSNELVTKVRLFCLIVTGTTNYNKRQAAAVKNTWAKRCDKYMFVSSIKDRDLPAIKVNVSEGRTWLWAKTKEGFKYVYKHHLKGFDWFLKADDNTYVIVENLKRLLTSYNPNQPLYLGCRIMKYGSDSISYMSGGAGYILSKEALRRFIEDAIPDSSKCSKKYYGAEDLEMGQCLDSVGVKFEDTRDKYGRHRFLPFQPSYHLSKRKNKSDFWFWERTYYSMALDGRDCCSDNAISFHYINREQMNMIDYLIYNLKY